MARLTRQDSTPTLLYRLWLSLPTNVDLTSLFCLLSRGSKSRRPEPPLNTQLYTSLHSTVDLDSLSFTFTCKFKVTKDQQTDVTSLFTKYVLDATPRPSRVALYEDQTKLLLRVDDTSVDVASGSVEEGEVPEGYALMWEMDMSQTRPAEMLCS